MSTLRGFAPPENVADLYLKKLDSSGLAETDGNLLGMSWCSAADAISLEIWFGYTPPTLLIPYTDPWGSKWDFLRGRALRDPPTIPKGYRKYGQRKGSPLRAYFPTLDTNWPSILTDPTHPLIFTEGELKAAKACKEGFPTIGLGGVWNFGGGKRGTQFIEELDRIEWENRKVYIAYDSDAADKVQVQEARQALANRLIQRGAYVFDIKIPELKKGQKVGLDDYLLVEGANAFQLLIDDAAEIPFDWQYFYQQGPTAPLSNLHNVLVALRNAPEIEDIFAYDQMRMVPVVMEPIPGEPASQSYPRLRTDTDTTRLQEWLQRHGNLVRIGPDVVQAGIAMRAEEQPYHPIREWLNATPWDGTERLATWVSKAFGITDKPEYHALIGSKFLQAMVARVMEPGCKADYMMVLEGGQGEMKSTACEILAGGSMWFSDSLPDIGEDEKRVSQHLRGKWLIEIAELGSIGKSHIDDVKKFLARKIEKFTPMYGRAEVEEPRQCVFVGTTNETSYLKDETGNRRFWPIVIIKIDIVWLRANRDQLLAEACVRYKAGEEWHPERELELSLIKPEQDARFIGSEWDEAISKFVFGELAIVADRSVYRVTTNQISESVLQIDIARRTSETGRRIAGTLRRMKMEERKSNGIRSFTPSAELLTALAEEAEKKAAEATQAKADKKARSGKVVTLKPPAIKKA